MTTRPKVVQLGGVRPDQQTIAYLKQLVEEAESGRAIGLIAAVHYGGSDYGYTGAGSLCANPALGVYALSVLQSKLL